MTTTMTEEILSLAESLQKESHTYAENLLKENPKLNYQDCVNTWIYLKLAEIIIKKPNKEKQYK